MSKAARPTRGRSASRRHADPETKAHALQLLRDGKSVADVAKTVGKHIATIYAWRTAARKSK